MLSERTTFAGNLGDHRAGRCLVVALSLLALGCVSSKSKIARAVEESDRSAVAIQGEARSADAKIESVEGLELPDAARPPLKSARKNLATIDDLALSVRGSNADARDGLEGVIDRPMPLWKKLALWLVCGLLLAAAALAFIPGLAQRALVLVAKSVGRATLSGAKLAREAIEEPDPVKAQEKLRQAVAAQRAGSRTYDAAWREAERKAVESGGPA